ncbi:hypothetical protein HYS93_01225 [Candidatus Daviesbacteria bacterium]|nr:hypothetical protein [Candidatus Daviesbacteria bacterium]
MNESTQRGLIPILVILVLFIGIFLGVYLVGQRTNFLPKAFSDTITSPSPSPSPSSEESPSPSPSESPSPSPSTISLPSPSPSPEEEDFEEEEDEEDPSPSPKPKSPQPSRKRSEEGYNYSNLTYRNFANKPLSSGNQDLDQIDFQRNQAQSNIGEEKPKGLIEQVVNFIAGVNQSIEKSLIDIFKSWGWLK